MSILTLWSRLQAIPQARTATTFDVRVHWSLQRAHDPNAFAPLQTTRLLRTCHSPSEELLLGEFDFYYAEARLQLAEAEQAAAAAGAGQMISRAEARSRVGCLLVATDCMEIMPLGPR